MSKGARRALTVLAVIILLPALLVAGVVLGGGALLNTEAVRARVVEAIARASGHAARIDGPIGIAWSLSPAISAERIALLNGPGYSRADFATVRRVEMRVALLPLLSGQVDVDGLWVEGPDALLERDAAGRGNWLAPPAPTKAAPAGPSRTHTSVTVGAVHVADATLAWAGPSPQSLRVQSLEITPAGGPVHGVLTVNGVPMALEGTTRATVDGGVPFEATAVGGGLALAASGQLGGAVAKPVAFEAKTADLSSLSRLVGQALPAVRDVDLIGQFGPGGLAGLTLTAGGSDLGRVLPGLTVVKLQGTMAAQDQPVSLLAQLALRGLPAALAVSVGPVGPGTMPVVAQVAADGGTLEVKGLLSGLEGRWTEATVAARVPDLARSGALAGWSMPGLHDVAVDARLQPPASGAGVLLRGLRITSAEGDLAGDLAVTTAPRPAVRGSLVSQRLDLDAWTAMAPVAIPPAPPAPPAAPALTLQPAPVAAPEPPRWLISDQPLPLAVLQQMDADVRWTAGSLVLRGTAYQSGMVRVLLQSGRLRVDPASVVAPSGPVQGLVQVDASATPPTAALALRGRAMDAAGVVAALGAPGAATGMVDVAIDLHAAGATPHALAASATGRAAMALTDGEIENAALARLFGPALRGANLPFDAAGRSQVRCLAMRLDIADGEAAVKALALDTGKLRLEGDGALNLGAETMDLHLRPTVRLGPTSVAVPVHLAGPWRSPRASADKGVIAPGRFGIMVGAVAPDPCGPALAEVRAP